MDVMTTVVHLPQYTQLDNDHMGEVRLMEVLRSLYEFPIEYIDIRRAEEQRKRIDSVVESSQEVKEIVAQLAAHYDEQSGSEKDEEKSELSPEVERFLKEMDRRFRMD